MSKEIVEKKGITGYLNRPDMQQYLNDVLGKNKDKFVTNLVSAYNQNKDLQKCTNTSIVSGAIIATTLNLSLNSSLGYAYLVPFKNGKVSKEKGYDVFDAQFQIGWKGYWQLALRTGEYKTINVIPVYKSQFKNWNALTEEIQLSDFDNFDNDEVAGYYAFFKLNNGFTKSMFWSREK
jgi:recombination protein RecT